MGDLINVHLAPESKTTLTAIGPGELTAPKALTVNGEPYQANTLLAVGSGELTIENATSETVVAEIRKSAKKESDAEPASQSD